MESIKVVCPHCDTINRVKAEVSREEIHCTTCGKSLNDTTPKACDEKSFITHINENEIAVLVDFFSPDCAPCMAMAPDFEAVAKKFPLEIRFLKVNTVDHPQIALRYKVNELPTMIAFLKGMEINRFTSALPAAQLEMWGESLIQMDYR
jgi:thioredoxin 2